MKFTPHKHFSVEEMKAREIIKGRERFVGENDRAEKTVIQVMLADLPS